MKICPKFSQGRYFIQALLQEICENIAEKMGPCAIYILKWLLKKYDLTGRILLLTLQIIYSSTCSEQYNYIDFKKLYFIIFYQIFWYGLKGGDFLQGAKEWGQFNVQGHW